MEGYHLALYHFTKHSYLKIHFSTLSKFWIVRLEEIKSNALASNLLVYIFDIRQNCARFFFFWFFFGVSLIHTDSLEQF